MYFVYCYFWLIACPIYITYVHVSRRSVATNYFWLVVKNRVLICLNNKTLPWKLNKVFMAPTYTINYVLYFSPSTVGTGLNTLDHTYKIWWSLLLAEAYLVIDKTKYPLSYSLMHGIISDKMQIKIVCYKQMIN